MKLFLKLFLFLLISVSANAFDFNNIYNVKTYSSTTLEINDTNLIDEKNSESLITNINNLNEALEEKSQELIKQNRDRKTVKYKGPIEDIFTDNANSVVFIGNRKNNRIQGIGTGFVIKHKNKLKIITNWHVIADADKLDVWLKPEKQVDENFLIQNVNSYNAKIFNIDKRKDLAILEVPKLSLKIKPLNFKEFNKIRHGESLFVIGHPNGQLWSFNEGRVSNIWPNYDWKYKRSNHKANVIQHQVPVSPGNSGGPVFSKDKELVGIVTFVDPEGQNLNFAVAADDVIDFLNEKPKKIKKSKNNKWIKKKDKGSTWIKKKDKKKKTDGSIDLSNAKEADINNNGIIDAWLIDENNNGIYEIAYGDTDENGIVDLLVMDKNENKIYEFTFVDSDEDGNPNIAKYDNDEDGKDDVIAYDYDQDGEWDKFENI
tara:strand:- start:25 stop:1314 length:1290 start_codon:yes stop_codon:yes gene_type:complete